MQYPVNGIFEYPLPRILKIYFGQRTVTTGFPERLILVYLNSMHTLNRFFWFCSGAHISTLEKHSTEQNKYVGIGATIFFTGLFAALSGGYAMYFVFAGNPIAPLLAILFGIIWGLAIFNMDRYIVSSINKSGTMGRQLLQATPRILLAIMIGIVISRPLELKIFNKEIKERLKLSYLNGQRSKIDTLNAAFSNKYKIEIGNLSGLKAQRDSLTKAIKVESQQLNFEIFGNKTAETSGITGYGTYAKRKEEALKSKNILLDTLNAHIAKGELFVADRKQFDGLMSEKLYTSDQLDSLANVAGFADRNWALGQLHYSANGKYDSSTAMAITFIGLLFIFFECLPVFVKLMSARGPYDHSISNIEEQDVMVSDRDLSVEKDVLSNIHPTRIETESAVRTERIRRNAGRQLEE